MINFSFKSRKAKIKNALDRRMNTAYLKDFNKALMNLELYHQEERLERFLKS